jgi:MinD-like ATPase involved in chromosome partitioning or flagellar assembly
MTIVAVVGDATTTTALAVAASWPTEDGAIVLEADPSGGTLAGWLDTPVHPSLATLVATIGTGADQRATLTTFDSMVRRTDSGIWFVPNVIRARAARGAVEEAAVGLVPAIARSRTTVLADLGRLAAGLPVPPVASAAEVIMVVHRQDRASAAAATVRIERLVETVEDLATSPGRMVLTVIGRVPFEAAEIGAFVEQSVPCSLFAVADVADDPLAAATLAGRAGVSAKRLRRLPLMRSAADVARLLASAVDDDEHAVATGTAAAGAPP